MKIKGQYQWTDYLNAQLLHFKTNGLIRIGVYGAFFGVILASVALLYLSISGQLETDISLFLPVLILALIFPLYRYVFLPYRVKKIFIQQKELGSPIEFELTETGLSASNEFGNSARPWSHFIKWKEDKGLIMLYYSDVLFTMIPKRFLSDPQQIETIKSYLGNIKVSKSQNRFLVGCIVYLILLAVIAAVMYLNFRGAVSP